MKKSQLVQKITKIPKKPVTYGYCVTQFSHCHTNLCVNCTQKLVYFINPLKKRQTCMIMNSRCNTSYVLVVYKFCMSCVPAVHGYQNRAIGLKN